MEKILSKSAPNIDISKKIAKEIFESLKIVGESFSVFLEGGLGAGKTFLVREILQNFEIEETIISPTYTYINEYEIELGKKFAHFDFYRMVESNAFFEKGFEEISSDQEVSCFVEWGEKISEEAKNSFSGKKFVIRIEFGEGVGMRKIEFFEIC
ncbi:tRNA (adenosine(37)-N6)-threonylcarbamoyltransferase complex ATPase subunit type 1 TsaE [Candidatus Gracilibacteria bacterium]|nr:tRNA (adenosine(37)-N6)-threonylcarbamoyltransferase complex ATPase subunit type 1 TsaE [Candidatus Gracilibacteria bacterium]